MKILQAVVLLAGNSSAEKVVVDRTVQLHLPVSENGVRSGKETYTVKKLVKSTFGPRLQVPVKKLVLKKIFQKISAPKQIESI